MDAGETESVSSWECENSFAEIILDFGGLETDDSMFIHTEKSTLASVQTQETGEPTRRCAWWIDGQTKMNLIGWKWMTLRSVQGQSVSKCTGIIVINMHTPICSSYSTQQSTKNIWSRVVFEDPYKRYATLDFDILGWHLSPFLSSSCSCARNFGESVRLHLTHLL